jgi:tight adherence protein B
MTAVLVVALVVALWLIARPSGSLPVRLRQALGANGRWPPSGNTGRPPRPFGFPFAARIRRSRRAPAAVPLTVVVQQLSALLKGGRAASRLWDELWLVYAADGRVGNEPADGAGLSPASLAMLASARAAATRGSPVADAIRAAARSVFSGGPASVGGIPAGAGRERRIWGELAACIDIAEASGCPLADVLTRLAAQLEVEDDAEAARQTALAGPKATVTLLTWLPLLGLGLGVALGVDPLAVLLGTPVGMAALAAGVALTVAGRIWSARLVRSAAGTP